MTERTRVQEEEKGPRLIFGLHLRCKRCKGKGTYSAGGETHPCGTCKGAGVTTNEGYTADPARAHELE